MLVTIIKQSPGVARIKYTLARREGASAHTHTQTHNARTRTQAHTHTYTQRTHAHGRTRNKLKTNPVRPSLSRSKIGVNERCSSGSVQFLPGDRKSGSHTHVCMPAQLIIINKHRVPEGSGSRYCLLSVVVVAVVAAADDSGGGGGGGKTKIMF